MTAYRQAIRLKPDYAEPYSNLGYALWDQGRLDEAVAAWSPGAPLQSRAGRGAFQPRHRAEGPGPTRRGGCRLSRGDPHQTRFRRRPFQPRHRAQGPGQVRRSDCRLPPSHSFQPRLGRRALERIPAEPAHRRFRARLGQQRMALEKPLLRAGDAQLCAAALAWRGASRWQDHPAPQRAGAGRHHPVLSLRPAGRRPRRPRCPRGAGTASATDVRPCRRIAVRLQGGGAAGFRPALSLAQPAIGVRNAARHHSLDDALFARAGAWAGLGSATRTKGSPQGRPWSGREIRAIATTASDRSS